MSTKRFHLGAILSVHTGLLLGRGTRGEAQREVADLLRFMTDDVVLEVSIPRMIDECRSALRAQHPWLASILGPSEFDSEAEAQAWLAKVAELHGAWHDVTPLDPDSHTPIDPIAEMRRRRPDMPIITVTDPGGGS